MLPQVTIPIAANTAAFNRALVGIETKIDSVANRTLKIGRAWDRVSNKMLATGARMTAVLTAPIALVGKKAVTAFADFDKAMTESLAITTGVTKGLRIEAENTARTLSTKLTSSAKDLAKGYFFLISSGLTLKQSLKALGPVARFAQAGAFDLATATSLAANAQAAMGLRSKNAAQNMTNLTRVTDVLVRANQLADATTLQFSESLTNMAAAIGKAYGQTIEEVTSVLAAMANRGLKGQRAGMAYSIILRFLTQAALKSTSAFKKWNIEVFNSEGALNSMTNIMVDMERAFVGLTSKQKQLALTELGIPVRGMNYIRFLEGASDEMRTHKKELQKAFGSTMRVAQKQLEAFSNQMKLLKNRIMLVAIDLGKVLSPVVIKIGKRIAKLTENFNGLDDATKMTIVKIATLVAVIGPALFLFGFIGKSIGFAIMVLAKFGAVIAGVLSGLASLPVAIAALAALVLIFDPTKSLAENAKDVFKGIVDGFNKIKEAVSEVGVAFWDRYGKSIVDMWENTIKPAWKTGTDFLRTSMEGILDSLTTSISAGGGFFLNFKENMTILMAWVADNWSAMLVDLGKELVNSIKFSYEHLSKIAINGVKSEEGSDSKGKTERMADGFMHGLRSTLDFLFKPVDEAMKIPSPERLDKILEGPTATDKFYDFIGRADEGVSKLNLNLGLMEKKLVSSSDIIKKWKDFIPSTPLAVAGGQSKWFGQGVQAPPTTTIEQKIEARAKRVAALQVKQTAMVENRTKRVAALQEKVDVRRQARTKALEVSMSEKISARAERITSGMFESLPFIPRFATPQTAMGPQDAPSDKRAPALLAGTAAAYEAVFGGKKTGKADEQTATNTKNMLKEQSITNENLTDIAAAVRENPGAETVGMEAGV